MKGTTHLAVGYLAGVVFASHLQQSGTQATIIPIVAATAALLPDIDKPTSMLGRRIPLLSIPASLFGHRTLFHAPLLYLLAYLFLAIQFPNHLILITAATIGIATHLLLDMLNPSGIPLLFPFASKRFHIANLRSGGFADWLLSIVLMALLITTIF